MKKINVDEIIEKCEQEFEFEVPDHLEGKHIWLNVSPVYRDGDENKELIGVHSYITDGNNDLGVVDDFIPIEEVI